MSAQVRHIKKDSREREISAPDLVACDTLAEQDGKRGAQDELSAPLLMYLEGEWHETLMKLARLAKLLKRKRRCDNCGHAL